jgi:eukaryotic-like serine/threonine-protein kinase
MRAFFKFFFLALVLIAVAMISALTAMRFAIHGREVAIPRLIGMTPNEAEKAAANSGLALLRESKFYSSDIAAGRIVSQLPQPGTRVRRGWRVRVAESLGPQRVDVPNLVGQSPRAADLNLRRRGLQVGSTAMVAMPEAAPDEVLAQSPPANAQGVASPKIDLLVASPPEAQALVMPNLSGMKLGEASVAITDAGLKLGDVVTGTESANAARTEAIVSKQFPIAGQKVFAGMTVALEVLR